MHLIQLWPDFLNWSVPVRSCLTLLLTSSTIALSIISLQIPKGIHKVENLSDCNSHALFDQFILSAVTGNVSISRCSCYLKSHIINTTREFITLESNPLYPLGYRQVFWAKSLRVNKILPSQKERNACLSHVTRSWVIHSWCLNL